MPVSFLSLGSNLGNRLEHLSDAVISLQNHPKVKVTKVSAVYQTKPVGGPEQDDYLNAVLEIETELSPTELLEVIQSIENGQDRVREVRWGPRTLDIDVLTYNDLILGDEKLTLPHPRISERAFVLVPWHEIAPDTVIAGVGELEGLYQQIPKLDVQLNSDMKLPEVN